MLLSLLVFATIAGAERPVPRLTLPEMLLSFLLAQLTVPLVQLTVCLFQLILQQLLLSSEVLRSFLLAQPAPPGLLLSVPLDQLPLAPLSWNVAPTNTRRS